MLDFITALHDTRPIPVLDTTKWRRIDGDPHIVSLNTYASAGGDKLMGAWIRTPGKQGMNYERREFCHFLDGYYVITPEGKQPVHLRADDVFVIESNLHSIWEAVGTMRKYLIFA